MSFGLMDGKLFAKLSKQYNANIFSYTDPNDT
jgi:hypothetical protein